MNAVTALSLFREEGRAYSPVAERATAFAFLVADTLALLAAYAITIVMRGEFASNALWPHYIRLIPFLAAVPLLIGMLGLYPGVLLNPVEEFRRLTIAISLGMSLVVVATFLLKESSSYSRLVFIAAVPLGIAFDLTARWLVRKVCPGADWWGIPTVLIGPAGEVETIRRMFDAQPSLGIRVVSIIEAERATRGFTGEDHIAKGTIPYALIIVPSGANQKWLRGVERVVWECRKIVVVPQSRGFLWPRMRIRECSGMVGLEAQRELLKRRSRITKRSMDCALTIVGGACVLLPVLVIAALVKLTSKGPAFYGHRRIGEGGRTIRIWKFRTMVEDADAMLQEWLRANPELCEEWEAQHKLKHDPRITRIGSLLRSTSLDELPQIWNVLRGEMSLVGPRPIVRDEIQFYAEEFDLYQKVRPGITGLWQVSGRSDTTYQTRVAMDVHYVRNWSVWLDVYLLAKTFRAVLKKDGAY